MTDHLAIALAQLNPIVGDIENNLDALCRARAAAAREGADLVVASELAIAGYPPEDLILKPAFQVAVEKAVETLAATTSDGGPAMIIGAPWRRDGEGRLRSGKRLYNAALLLDQGQVAAVRLKHDLPNYGVFDEKRVFARGPLPGPVNFRGVRLGLMVCEDMWRPDVAECLGATGAEILVVLNGSPYDQRKPDIRVELAVARVVETGLPLIYVNQVGGQDELVFDGGSFILGRDRRLRLQAPFWREDVSLARWQREAEGWGCGEGVLSPVPDHSEMIYSALLLGLRDYVEKNGFPGVVLGLSGGIDSALAAALAADALGAGRVRGVMMPSPYTSAESLEDAAQLAANLEIKYETVPIEGGMKAFGDMLAATFADCDADTTEENIQARLRGMILMAISNKFGPMVLSTGNKSEMSVGYATLYGDMCGGFSVLKDVYKGTVYDLARWRNNYLPAGALGPRGEVIPARIILKAPSAELKPGQTDQDTLPPYDELDDILTCLIEEDLSVEDITARGHRRETVTRVWKMLESAEYKRRQAPPGVKVTTRSFGRDRRYPITNRFTGSV